MFRQIEPFEIPAQGNQVPVRRIPGPDAFVPYTYFQLEFRARRQFCRCDYQEDLSCLRLTDSLYWLGFKREKAIKSLYQNEQNLRFQP